MAIGVFTGLWEALTGISLSETKPGENTSTETHRVMIVKDGAGNVLYVLTEPTVENFIKDLPKLRNSLNSLRREVKAPAVYADSIRFMFPGNTTYQPTGEFRRVLFDEFKLNPDLIFSIGAPA